MILEGLDEMVAHYYEMDHVRRPFVIGVLGDFSGSLLQPLPPVGERHFLDIDYDNFSDRLKALRPRVAFRIATTVDLVSPAEVPVELIFTCLEDFSPIGVVRQVRGLRDWLDARKPVPPFIDGSIGRLAEREPKLETISALADGRHYEGVAWEVASERDINIHQQLNAIFHHPDFQRLEATWRGLHWLVTHSAAGGNIRIRCFDISDSELRKVLKKFKVSARDSSPIFRKIYDEELDTFGGHPYNLIIGDYYYSQTPQDVETLGELSHIAAAAGAVFLAGAAARLFGEASYGQMGTLRDPNRLFPSAEYAAWRSLSDQTDSGMLALALPRVLFRAPYRWWRDPASGFVFTEDMDELEALLWGNPAYVVGAELMAAFARHRFYAALPDLPEGGVVCGLPTIRRNDRASIIRSSLEKDFSARERGQLEAAGLIALYHLPDSLRVVYSRAASLGYPPRATARPHDATPSFLREWMQFNREWHGLRAWMRVLEGMVATKTELLKAATAWLRRSVAATDHPTLAEKIQFPLRSFNIDLEEIEGLSQLRDVFQSTRLKVHFQSHISIMERLLDHD